ncbi:transposable element Tcb2 transposase [Trichonephila clavipes]|nr:transposable element Tcb2 transposase [Trichonephila clavipes]
MKSPVRLTISTNKRRLVQGHETTPLKVEGDIEDISSELESGILRLHFLDEAPRILLFSARKRRQLRTLFSVTEGLQLPISPAAIIMATLMVCLNAKFSMDLTRVAEKALYARRPTAYVYLNPSQKSSPYEEHVTRANQESSRVHFTDQFKFSSSRGSFRVFTQSIMLDSRTPVHIFGTSSVTVQRYKNKVLEPHMRLFRGVIGQDFIFIDDNTSPYRANHVEDFHEEKGICRRE